MKYKTNQKNWNPQRPNPIVKCLGSLAVCLCGTLAQGQITNGLVLHLPFDGDYSNTRGNGVTATAVGAPTFGTGKIGSAVALTTLKDGSSFNYVTLGYPDLLKFGAVSDGSAVDFSIAFWCNYTNQVDDPPFISNKDWGSSNNKGWGIFTQGGSNGRINTTDDQGSSGKQNTTSTGALRDGTWHHLVVTWQRQSVVTVYVDGKVATTSSLTPVVNSIDTVDKSENVNIGQDGTGSYTDGGSAEMVNLLMDDLGIWRRVLSPGEVLAVYNAGLGGTNLANVPAIVNPFVKSTSPASGAAGVRPDAQVSAVITDGLNLVAADSIRLSVNGQQVPVTNSKVGSDTTVVYAPTNFLASDLNTAVLIYGNNATPQTFFTNTWTFTVSHYVTLTSDLKVTPDTSKPGFIWNVFANAANSQASNARAQAALAGQLKDENGAPLPNFADPNAQGIASAPASPANPANVPISFVIPTVINLNDVGGSGAGNFGSDDQMPGLPSADGTSVGAAAEIITYLDLPAGLITMGVNSDDGFRTEAGKTRDVLTSLVAGEYDGSRTAADTLFYINVKEAGVYAFRTLWENATGGADIEWFTVKPDGTKVLVNDKVNGGVAAYRAASGSVAPYVKYVSPSPVPRQANQTVSSLVLVLADGSTAVDDASVQLKLDGAAATVTKARSGSSLTVTYAPASILFPADLHHAELAYKDVPGTLTQSVAWAFCSLKNIVLPAPAIFENFDSYTEGDVPTGWAQTNYTDTDVAGIDLDNLHSDSYKGWVVVSDSRLQGLKSRIFNVAPNQFSNGVPVTELGSGNMLYAESDVRGGNQAQFLYSKPYNLSTLTNAAIAFSSYYEQNQDSMGSVEYSVDGGNSWLPAIYFLDFVDSGGDIKLNSDGSVDAVATFTGANGDTASWTVNGVQKGGNYGDGIAAPITQALGRFVAPRANDDATEGKRIEICRLDNAGGKSDVRLRFAQLGTGSWYFGVDNLGFYEVPPFTSTSPGQPGKLTIGLSSGKVVISWTGSGTLQSATSVSGTWSDVSGNPTSPVTITPAAGQVFYRLRQ